MKGFLCSAAFLLLTGLSGCGSAGLFRDYPTAESPDVAAAPWPRLADTPAAPPKGEYGAGVPDPATGAAAIAVLSAEAQASAARAAALAEPVLSPEERARLGQE